MHTKPVEGQGYIHHDIKPDNILIRSPSLNHYESSLFNLIDFSVSSIAPQKLTSENNLLKKHEEIQSIQSLEDEFNGNLVFASLD